MTRLTAEGATRVTIDPGSQAELLRSLGMHEALRSVETQQALQLQ